METSAFHLVAKFKQLKVLDMELCLTELHAREAALAGLSGLCNLEVLKLQMGGPYALGSCANLPCISHLMQLSNVLLVNVKGGLCAVAGVSALQQLSIEVSEPWAGPEPMPATLSSMRSLTVLQLDLAMLNPPEHVTALGTLPALASLSLKGTSNLASRDVCNALFTLTTLTILMVHNINLAGFAWSCLAGLNQLQVLRFNETSKLVPTMYWPTSERRKIFTKNIWVSRA